GNSPYRVKSYLPGRIFPTTLTVATIPRAVPMEGGKAHGRQYAFATEFASAFLRRGDCRCGRRRIVFDRFELRGHYTANLVESPADRSRVRAAHAREHGARRSEQGARAGTGTGRAAARVERRSCHRGALPLVGRDRPRLLAARLVQRRVLVEAV